MTTISKKQYKHRADTFSLLGTCEKCSDKRLNSKFADAKERLPLYFNGLWICS